MDEVRNNANGRLEGQFDQIPFERIERLGQRSLLYRDLFCVSWLLGRYCNYRCSYCWPHGRSDVRDHRPADLVISTLEEIKRQARERGFNSFHFSFSGGEPTLHPGYLEILQHYSADTENCNSQTLHMTTNLSAGNGWFKKYAHVTKDLHRVSITASFHKEFAQRESFAEKLIALQEYDIQVTINMVMAPARFQELWDDALYFQEMGINVTLKPQSDPMASHVVAGYTAEQLQRLRVGMPQRDFTEARLREIKRRSLRPKYKHILGGRPEEDTPFDGPRKTFQVELTDELGAHWYLDQAERLNAFGFNRFQGWECAAGYQSIIIREPDGAIKRSYSCHDEPLGNINTGFSLFPTLQKCLTPTCVSSADSKIPKRRSGSALPLFTVPAQISPA